jgi:hypothetical protein
MLRDVVQLLSESGICTAWIASGDNKKDRPGSQDPGRSIFVPRVQLASRCLLPGKLSYPSMKQSSLYADSVLTAT